MIRTLALSLLVLFAFTAPAFADDHAADPSVLVVKIHADWCGTCKALEPTWSELEGEPNAQLVVLDITDDATKEGALATAKELGIESFYEAHGNKSGTVGVLDAKSGELIAVHKGELDAEVYRKAIAGHAAANAS